MIRILFGFLLLATFSANAFAGPTVDKFAYGKFGELTVYRNTPEPKQMVLFVSGDGGWNLGVIAMAKQLATRDATVVGIDVRKLLGSLEATKEACAYPAADFEQLSQFVQKKLGFKAYHRPVLVGYSSGATIVYALLGQAPRGTFLGAISLGFCPDLEIKHPWCKGFGLEYKKRADGKGVDFSAMPSITDPWRVLQGEQDQVCNSASTRAFVSQVPSGKLYSLPSVGHGFSVERNWMPQFTTAFDEIVAASRHPAPLPPIGQSATPANVDVANLPLVEVPAASNDGDTFAILMTGDGGWAGLDREVASRLAAQRIPVVGFDTLSYFWSKRTPEETASAVGSVIAHYQAAWHKRRVILIGYSFGADVMPFVARRLPADTRAQVRLMTLIVPSKSAQFEFHVAEWAGFAASDSVPTMPELQSLTGLRMLCIYGTEEKDSPCPLLTSTGAKIVGLKGGHHVGGDYDGLVREIMSAAGS